MKFPSPWRRSPSLRASSNVAWFEPIPRSVYAAASALTVTALLGGWAWLTYAGLVRPEFLPAPHHVVLAAVGLA